MFSDVPAVWLMFFLGPPSDRLKAGPKGRPARGVYASQVEGCHLPAIWPGVRAAGRGERALYVRLTDS